MNIATRAQHLLQLGECLEANRVGTGAVITEVAADLARVILAVDLEHTYMVERCIYRAGARVLCKRSDSAYTYLTIVL